MGRVLTYVLLFPFLVGLPFLGIGLTGPFWKYVLDVYLLMTIPALCLAAIDFLLGKHLRWQGIACAVGGAVAAILAVNIGLDTFDAQINMFIGVIGALAGTVCWMGARGATIMVGKA